MIQKYEGKTLENMIIVVDDSIVINCVLKGCDLVYSGGDAEMVNTRLDGCRLHFRGAAQKTIQALQTFGMLKVGPLPVPMKMEVGKVN